MRTQFTKQKNEPAVKVPELSFNEEKKGIEIRFSENPGEAVRELLKESGYRWNPYGRSKIKYSDPVWYCRQSPKALAVARGVIKIVGGIDKTMNEQPTPEPVDEPVLEGSVA